MNSTTGALTPTVIPDVPIPMLLTSQPNPNTSNAYGTQGSVDGGLTPTEIPNADIPSAQAASDVIATSIDTQQRKILGNFTFGEIGAIQIGNFGGGNGQINISPNGIVAVDGSGNPTFTLDGLTGSATFKGTIAAGSIVTNYIHVGDAAGDVNSNSTTISGGKITTNSITASQIAANTIDASRLNVSNLSAITANMGTLNAGTINGGNINGGAQISVGGVNIVGSGIVMNNNVVSGWKDTGGSLNFAMYTDGSNNHIIATTSGDLLLLPSGKISMGNNINMNGHNIDNCGDIFPHNINCNTITTSSSTINIGGTTKSAIVPTKDGYKALYCVEAPEVWFFDFYNPEIGVDPRFEEVTEGIHKTITMDDGDILIFRRRKGYGNTRFASKTVEQFEKNESFLQQAI